MKRKPLIDKDGEVRELTKADLRKFRPAQDVVPQIVAAHRRSRGRPAGRRKEAVTLSLDADLVLALRSTGKGWQTRANTVLRKSLKLPPVREPLRT